jgi:hypothetical protein
MSNLENPLQTEPVATLGAASWALIMTGVALLPVFGVDVTLEQQGAIGAFVTALITFVTIYQRSRVYSPHTVEHIKDDAQEAVAKAYKARPGVDPMPRVDKAA